MPAVLIIADDVAALLGGPTLGPLLAGQVGPAAAQCWQCGGGARIKGGRDESVTLSVLLAGPDRYLTLFAHVACSPSRTVTHEELDASPASHIPSPVPAEDQTVLVDRVADDGGYPAEALLVCPRCPACDQPPQMLIGGGSQAFCGNEACNTWAWNALEPKDSPSNTVVHHVDLSALRPASADPRDMTTALPDEWWEVR